MPTGVEGDGRGAEAGLKVFGVLVVNHRYWRVVRWQGFGMLRKRKRGWIVKSSMKPLKVKLCANGGGKNPGDS